MNVRKAVIPVAGFGTRFLPVTKAVPKGASCPYSTHPSYISPSRRPPRPASSTWSWSSQPQQEAIGAYFDESTDLERMLERQGRSSLLERMPDFSNELKITYVQQREPLGNGHAVLVAKQSVGNEPFAVLSAGRRHPGRRLDHRADDRDLWRDRRAGYRCGGDSGRRRSRKRESLRLRSRTAGCMR